MKILNNPQHFKNKIVRILLTVNKKMIMNLKKMKYSKHHKNKIVRNLLTLNNKKMINLKKMNNPKHLKINIIWILINLNKKVKILSYMITMKISQQINRIKILKKTKIIYPFQ